MKVNLFKQLLLRLISVWLIFSFMLSGMPVYGQSINLPATETMVFSSQDYMPVIMKGIKVHPDNPLLFDFILDTGKSALKITSPQFKAESQKLIKYFLASLTIKEDDLWVNLSPYEKDRMIPKELGKTELGRDMLAQDYILKQLTSSLFYPEQELGKKFWDNVYAKTEKLYGVTDIPVDTFNKVWIVADKAKVLERNNAAYIVGSHLKVMLEEDYVALNKSSQHQKTINDKNNKEHTVASQIIREVIIPEIEKEVNRGEHFAPLRQMFYSMILASWYKIALKDALLNQVYSNKEKTSGVLSDDLSAKEKIYEQYLASYKKGVFNYIREDLDAVNKDIIPRKYFSGGEKLGLQVNKNLFISHKKSRDDLSLKDGDLAMVRALIGRSEDAGMNEEKPVNAYSDAAMKLFEDGNIEIADTVDAETVEYEIILNPELRAARQSGRSNIFISGIPESTQNELLKEDYFKKMIQIDVRDFFQAEKRENTIVRLKQFLEVGNKIVLHHFTEGQNDLNAQEESCIMKVFSILRENNQNRVQNVCILSADFVDLRLFAEISFKDPYSKRMPFYNYADYFFFDGLEIKAGDKYEPRKDFSLLEYGAENYKKKIDNLKTGEEILLSLKDNEYDFYNISFRVRYGILSNTPSLEYKGNGVWRKKTTDSSEIAKQSEDLGGIALNGKKMGIDIAKDGKAVEIKFDQAIVAEFQKGNFSGVEGKILEIISIQNPML